MRGILMNVRYRLRLKAFDDMFCTDKALRLEHKGIIALAKSWFPHETGFTAADLAEFTCEDKETIGGYLRELDKARYIDHVPYSDEDRI